VISVAPPRLRRLRAPAVAVAVRLDHAGETSRNRIARAKARRLLCTTSMRPRTLISDVQKDAPPPARPDTYERVRRTLDEALAELQLPLPRPDDSGLFSLTPSS
jgi:hypothetical protein